MQREEPLIGGRKALGITRISAKRVAEAIYKGKKTLRAFEMEQRESGGMGFYELVKYYLDEIKARPQERKEEARREAETVEKAPKRTVKKEFAPAVVTASMEHPGLLLAKSPSESLRSDDGASDPGSPAERYESVASRRERLLAAALGHTDKKAVKEEVRAAILKRA